MTLDEALGVLEDFVSNMRPTGEDDLHAAVALVALRAIEKVNALEEHMRRGN